MLKTELEKNLGRKLSDSTYTRLKRECKQAQIELCRENLKIISVAKTYSTKHRLPTAQTLKLFKSFGELPELSLTREQLVSYLIKRTGAHKPPSTGGYLTRLTIPPSKKQLLKRYRTASKTNKT